MATLPRIRPCPPSRGTRGDRRRALALLAATSAIGGAGLAAGGTAGALVGAQLAGTEAAAGLPLGLVVLGSAGAALLVSRQASRVGRGWSLATGYLMGTTGALLVVLATIASSLTLLLAGSLLLGGANASIFLTRYAAAEIGDEHAEGRALGLILCSTAIGAVASPLLLDPSGELAQTVGLPRLSGLFVIATLTFGTAALTLGRAAHRPATRGVAALLRTEAVAPPPWSQFLAGTRAPPASLGLAVLVTANFVMVAFMAVAPIHLTGHGESLATVGAVISLHVAAMFGPSPLSGRLADRIGPVAVAAIGCLLILIAGLGGAAVDQEDVRWIALVLVVLGVGWNFAVVGGSTLIARSTPPALRVHIEGIGEAAMGVAAAAAAPAAGVIIAFGSFTALSVAGAAIAASALIGGAVTKPMRAP
jgi:MFS family permease